MFHVVIVSRYSFSLQVTRIRHLDLSAELGPSIQLKGKRLRNNCFWGGHCCHERVPVQSHRVWAQGSQVPLCQVTCILSQKPAEPGRDDPSRSTVQSWPLLSSAPDAMACDTEGQLLPIQESMFRVLELSPRPAGL